MKKCALRQNKARCKRILSQANEDEDNIGLTGGTCENHVNINKLYKSFYYSDSCGEKKSRTSQTQTPETDQDLYYA